MKTLLLGAAVAVMTVTSCSTVQSIVQNAFPYTTNVLVPSGTAANQEISSVSAATSIAQFAGATNNQVKDVRIANAKISVVSPTGQNLGMFKSVKVYISGNNTGEVLVASRQDIGDNVGTQINLDPDTSRVLDNYVINQNVKVRLAYVLKERSTVDTNIKVSLGFTSTPVSPVGQ